MEEDLETQPGEWTRYEIKLPVDDFDEDDELDALIEKINSKKRNHIDRGRFFGI